MAQTGEPFEFISDFIHRKDLKVHPVAKLGMPPTQGKQHCPLPTTLAASPTFSFSSPAIAPHHKPQNEVVLPHFWVSLFVAQTWEPFEFIPDFIHRKNLKVHPVTKLDLPPTQGKQTVLCQQHWQLHQLSASRLLQWPQHPTPQNEVLLPHLWVSLFMAQTWEPFEFISDLIHRKDLKVHPVTKLDMPPTQGKQYCPLPTALAASPTFSFSSPAMAPASHTSK